MGVARRRILLTLPEILKFVTHLKSFVSTSTALMPISYPLLLIFAALESWVVNPVEEGTGRLSRALLVRFEYRSATSSRRPLSSPSSTPISACAVLSHFRLGLASCKGWVPGASPLVGELG